MAAKFLSRSIYHNEQSLDVKTVAYFISYLEVWKQQWEQPAEILASPLSFDSSEGTTTRGMWPLNLKCWPLPTSRALPHCDSVSPADLVLEAEVKKETQRSKQRLQRGRTISVCILQYLLTGFETQGPLLPAQLKQLPCVEHKTQLNFWAMITDGHVATSL